MNSLSSLTQYRVKSIVADIFSNWVEMPNAALGSSSTSAGGGRCMFYDNDTGILYLTTTSALPGTSQTMYWGFVQGNAFGRGYTLAGYNTNTMQMFALNNTPSSMVGVNSFTDYITKINGNLWISSTAFAGNGNIAIYNLSTSTWSNPPNMTTINGRIQMFAYDSVNNSIYMGGNFTSNLYGNYITKYSLTTNTLLNLDCSGVNAPVSQLIYDNINQRLYVNATTIINANTASGVVSSLGVGGIGIYNVPNRSWVNANVNIQGGGVNVCCFCGDFGKNKLYVGMDANTAGNITTNGVGVLNTSTLAWSSIGLKSTLKGANAWNVPSSMIMYNGNLFVGGGFNSVNIDGNINYVFKYVPTTNRIVKVTNNYFTRTANVSNTAITSMAVDPSGTLYSQGRFSAPHSYLGNFGSSATTANNLIIYDKNTGTVSSKLWLIQNINTGVVLNDTTVVLGGGFLNLSVNGVMFSGYAVLNPTTGVLTNNLGNATCNGYVNEILYYPKNNSLYFLSGGFTTFAGFTTNLVRYDISSNVFYNLSGGYTVGGGNTNKAAYIDTSNGLIYTRATGPPYTMVYNITTNTWSDYSDGSTGKPGITYFLVVPELDTILTWNQSSSTTMGKFKISTKVWTSITINIVSMGGTIVRAADVDISNQIVYFGGSFYSINGVNTYRSVAKYDINTNTFSPIVPDGDIVSPVGGIRWMKYDSLENCLYVGGSFIHVGNSKKIATFAKYSFAQQEWLSGFSNPSVMSIPYLESINSASYSEGNYFGGNYCFFTNNFIILNTPTWGYDLSYNYLNMAKTYLT